MREVLNALESSGVSGDDDEENIACVWRAVSAFSRPFSLAPAPQVREGKLSTASSSSSSSSSSRLGEEVAALRAADAVSGWDACRRLRMVANCLATLAANRLPPPYASPRLEGMLTYADVFLRMLTHACVC
jgi:hypothetical protein